MIDRAELCEFLEPQRSDVGRSDSSAAGGGRKPAATRLKSAGVF